MNKLNPPLNFLPNIREEGYNKKKYNAFTLVELIVVITILAILGTIAFISLQGYSAQSRDAVRISDLSSIKTGLELYNLDAGKYPSPNDETVITYSGAVAWTQGTFGEQAKKNIDKLDKVPTDPLTDKKYVYSTNSTRYEFQLAGAMEGDEVTLNPSQVSAASTKTAKLKITGNYNGKLLKVSTGSTDYVLALPSIMAYSGTTVETITANNYLAYNGYKNLPFQYDGAYKTDGETALSLVSTTNYVVFSGSLSTLSDTTSTGINARKVLIDKLQLAYNGTSITGIGEIAQILNTNTSDPTATEYVATNLVANNLGGSIVASTTSGSSSSTGSTNTGTTSIGGIDSNTVLMLENEFDSSASQQSGTFNGNTSISNVNKKYGKGSYSFDGNTDYIQLDENTDADFGSGDFTIDFWVKPNSFASEQGLINNEGKWWFSVSNDSKFHAYFTIGGGVWNVQLNSSSTYTANQWYHVAAVRNGTSVKLYINGVEQASATVSGTIPEYSGTCSFQKWSIGAGCDGSSGFNGNIDEFRISKGIARWTSNFSSSLPTEYTTDSNTKLLLHSEGDISNGNNNITLNGNIDKESGIGKFSGSYKFNGTDYITITNHNNFNWYTSNFTIDGWIKMNTFTNRSGGASVMVGNIDPNSPTNYWSFGPNSTGKLVFYYYNGTTNYVTSSNNISLNTWTHIAMTYDGTNIKLYINGIEDTNALVSGTPQFSLGTPLTFGRNDSTNFIGNIDEFRISKGIARWSTSFTPPTGPYTN